MEKETIGFWRRYKRFWWVLALLIVVVIGLGFFIRREGESTEESNNQTSGFQKAKAEDQVKEEIETTYYDISGTTKAQLNAQMAANGPDCGGEECYAYTEWAIDWSSPISNTATCEPVASVVKITYTLPRWTNKSSASASLQTEWDRYFQKLLAHEEHHKDIVVQYAQQFLDKIKEINAEDYQSCQELEDKIGEYWATGEILNACAQATEKYDTDTNHGATEGVVL